MHLLLCCAALFLPLFVKAAGAGDQAPPKITAIDHVALYTENLAVSTTFYTDVLGAKETQDPQNPGGRRFYFSTAQFVSVLPLPATPQATRMAYIAYRVSNARALRDQLSATAALSAGPLTVDPDGTQWFEARDPEQNRVRFEQRSTPSFACYSDVSCRVIHAGFLVKDHVTEDTFYRTALHFTPYWYGAFTPGKVDWISQQVPGGQEWLEYMMANDHSDTSANKVGFKELGGMNHISLGVRNMEETVTMLLKAKRLSGFYNGPQMGLDGKWQTNLYDPDGTRIELMEYMPSMAPCCSPITGPNPSIP